MTTFYSHSVPCGRRNRSRLEQQEGEILTLVQAAQTRKRSRVKQLVVAQPALIKGATTRGRTPLHKAVNCGDFVSASKLIRQGVFLSVPDGRGWTPLHVAAHGGYEPLARLLCNAKVDLDSRTGKGKSALSLAVEKGHEDIVRLFVMLGADLEAADENGWRPLHVACAKESRKIVQHLLQAGASLGARTSFACKSKTPLMVAVVHNQLDVVYDILCFSYRTKVNNLMRDGQSIETCYEKVDIPDYSRLIWLVKQKNVQKLTSLFNYFSQPIKDIAYLFVPKKYSAISLDLKL